MSRPDSEITACNIKPSMISVNRHFCDTFGNWETETIARNVVIICRKNGDEWRPFTAAEYISRCTHGGARNEIGYLDALTRCGALRKEGDHYVVTDAFIKAVRNYIQ